MSKYILISIFILISYINILASTYSDDSLIVQSILDTNGWSSVSVEAVTQINDSGRISLLNLQRTTGPHITIVPTKIAQLSNLTQLDLSNNYNLTTIPNELGQLSKLNELNLNACSISFLPGDIGLLKELNTLTLYGNDLTSLPKEIGNLTKLISLHLGENELVSLPSEIGKLKNLKYLHLWANDLIMLPDSIININPKMHFDDEHCSFDYNRLDTNNLSEEIVDWLDTNDPDWKETQLDAPVSLYKNTSEIPSANLLIYNNNQRIHFYMQNSGNITLSLFNLHGKTIYTLISGDYIGGWHQLDISNLCISSGVYYLQLKTHYFVKNAKIILR